MYLHVVCKSLKMSHLNFGIFSFARNVKWDVFLWFSTIVCICILPSILAEDLWRPILQLAASSYPLSWGAEEALEEPLVPTQLDIFRLLELLQLPLPFGEEVEPPREDELELLRVCKNKKHALTQSRGDRQHVRKKSWNESFLPEVKSVLLQRKVSERDKQNYSKKTVAKTFKTVQTLTLFAKRQFMKLQNEN